MSGPLLKDSYELAVVGAGPAGMAAATQAAELGIETVVFDEQAMPGGQIYRSMNETPLRDPAILGEAYWRGAALVEAFQRSAAQYVPQATVWTVSREGEIGVSVGGAVRLLRAKRVVLATGALERPFPIGGWTLPGVMTAGAAQILLKSAAMVGSGRVVLAGTGPLLWLLAAQYLRAGGALTAILETTPRGNLGRALAHLPGFLASGYLREGFALLGEVRRRANLVRSVIALRAGGGDRLTDVTYRTAGGLEVTLRADILLLHQGVVPNLNLAVAIGCKHVWNEVQLCFVPVLDAWGQSSVETVAIAGDGGGIAGAVAAEARGHLAALDAACRLGSIDAAARDRLAATHVGALREAQRGRRFLDRLFRPAKRFRLARGRTLVCRCEEVTARQVRDAAALERIGPNQLKAFLRCGMGPCQGRLCGLTVTEMLADAHGVSPDDIGYYRLRPPVKPITVGELASLPKSEADIAAVERS
ncbi:MAG TPA: NAD(P)/FAD-dependent oxidoreductase [Stellaceae bacterium]|nr:NAD(P)/FAD-dependent oxidoreductase [Stellaceae bacterium]